MDIEKKVSVIRDEIMEEVAEKRDKVVESERKKWEKRYNVFREDIEEEKEKILNSYEQEAKNRREQIISRVTLESKRKIREQKNDYLEQLMAELKKKLIDYRQQEGYSDFLKKLIVEAIQILDAKQVYLQFNQDDLKIYQNTLAEELAQDFADYELMVKEDCVDIDGGVIVESSDRKEVVENSFKTCIQNVKEDVGRELESII